MDLYQRLRVFCKPKIALRNLVRSGRSRGLLIAGFTIQHILCANPLLRWHVYGTHHKNAFCPCWSPTQNIRDLVIGCQLIRKLGTSSKGFDIWPWNV